MKLFKKIATLALAAITFLAFGVLAACEKTNQGTSSGSDANPVDYVYKIRVQSEGGFGIRNVDVSLYDNGKKLVTKTTSSEGNAFFLDEDISKTGAYEVKLDSIPNGWSLDSSVKYQTSKVEKTDLSISLTASLIESEAEPSTRYRLGDVMHNFTVNTSDGNSYTLSDILQEKDMVLLNFWATWCGPCKSEFPAMQNAFIEAQDNVSILAISTTDSMDAVATFKNDQGLSFPMTGGTNLPTYFSVSSVPASIVVDRYGVISWWHVGAMTAKSDFLGLFDKFTGEDYVQTVIGENDYNGNGNTGTEEIEKVLPNVSAPSFANVDKALDPNGIIDVSSYKWDKDEYSWPFTVEKDANGEEYLRASNADVHNSYSILHFEYEAQANTALTFDAIVSTEAYDYFYIFVDGAPIHKLSAQTPDTETWTTYVAYVFEATQAGKHDISISYIKDGSESGGEDEVWIKNLSTMSKADLNNDNYDVNIFRYAATEPQTDENATTAYKKYITPVLSNVDGYYHVGSADGPILMAGIMTPVLWNTYDLWQLAAADLLVVDGMNFKGVLEDYAWAVNQDPVTSNGYYPVTVNLKETLDFLMHASIEYELSDKPYHENEWLELCVYYDHYGTTPQLRDPMIGITFDAAIEIDINKDQKINCNYSLVPLGIKHKFTTDKAGVYHIYSKFAKADEGKSSDKDPQAWIVAPDQKTFLAYADDTIVGAYDGNTDNFDIVLTLEANTTYYALFAFFLNSTGTITVRIDYEGESFEYLKNCAIDPPEFNPVTNETYQPNTVEYALGEDGFYHVVKADGSLGSYIYLDMINPTFLFPTETLQRVIENANKYEASKRLFFLNGKDYTEEMNKYLAMANRNTGVLKGLVEIDEPLMEILLLLTKKADGFDGLENSWQRMCYYMETYGQNE